MKKLILFSIVFLLMLSCRKRCREEASTKRYLDSELEGYFRVFKKGNYWLYQNQNKSKTDSIYVTESHTYFSANEGPCTDVEILEFTLKEKGNDIIIHDDSVCIKANYNQLNFRFCPSGGFFIDFFYLMHFHSDSIYSTEGKVNRINSITLNNVVFVNEIIEIYYNTDTLYVQKNVGIIGWKKKSDTYNLIK